MKKKTQLHKPVRSPDAPATAGMLYEMEERINHRIDSGFHELKSDIHGIKAEVHRIALLVEEQNARNKFVLDGYAQLYDFIERKIGI